MSSLDIIALQLRTLYDSYYSQIMLTTPIREDTKTLFNSLFSDTDIIIKLLLKIIKKKSIHHTCQHNIDELQQQLQNCRAKLIGQENQIISSPQQQKIYTGDTDTVITQINNELSDIQKNIYDISTNIDLQNIIRMVIEKSELEKKMVGLQKLSEYDERKYNEFNNKFNIIIEKLTKSIDEVDEHKKKLQLLYSNVNSMRQQIEKISSQKNISDEQQKKINIIINECGELIKNIQLISEVISNNIDTVRKDIIELTTQILTLNTDILKLFHSISDMIRNNDAIIKSQVSEYSKKLKTMEINVERYDRKLGLLKHLEDKNKSAIYSFNSNKSNIDYAKTIIVECKKILENNK